MKANADFTHGPKCEASPCVEPSCMWRQKTPAEIRDDLITGIRIHAPNLSQRDAEDYADRMIAAGRNAIS